MPLAENTLPYGLRDVKLSPIDDAGAVGTAVDLPASRVFSFSEAEEFEELRGDDKVIAIRGKGPSVEWSLEAGGISLNAYVVMSGGTVVEAGATPAETRTLTKLVTDNRPYFQAEGQAISDSGGDFHAKIFKCRASDSLEGELSDGTFFLSSASGTGIGNDSDELYEFTANETAVAIA